MNLNDFLSERIYAYQLKLRKLSYRELYYEGYRILRMWKKGRPTFWRLKEIKEEFRFREIA